MELFRTDTHFIFVRERHNLWCDRFTGELSAKSDWEWASATNLECLGMLYGIVGKIEQPSVMEPRIMLIKEVSSVGELHGGRTVYKIKSVAFLRIGSDNAELGLRSCKKHQSLPKKTFRTALFADVPQKAGFAKTWGTIKSAGNTIKNTTQQAAAMATSQVKSTVIKRGGPGKDRERLEKRILEELTKIFTETDSFFFCRTGDITNSLQRRHAYKESQLNQGDREEAPWKRIDDRFFWNKNMLRDIIDLNSEAADCWILPIIQGFVQIEKCKVEVGFDGQPQYEIFNLAIVSRRSRFRAGTRYKRRGVDEDGKCANYVETEQLVWYHDHQVSFVQVRGSVPVYWSQPGYKYKPPPRIDKDEAETQVAFEKHFAEEQSKYGPICIVNLVEQSGKEKIIWDAYNNHVINYNSPAITYASFDFHEYCRGMHFENVSILVSALAATLGEMGYCWHDEQGPICMQKGVFRVNCIDCLDRTNVVQTALGKTVMEMQFSKLGLIPPDGTLPTDIRQTFQLLWANNGDIISKQYAGTNALKGDYTRTGERKFTGLMKDGVNSANRYYRQHFLDDTRQAAIDISLGCNIDVERINDHWSDYVKIIDNRCLELVPAKPPKIHLQIATHPEFLYATAMFQLTRYYLNRFKDVYRQASIDLMLGKPVNEDTFQERTEEEDNAATAFHVKLLIEDCKKLLIPDPEIILGSWGLIDADPVTGDPSETEMDTILILSRDSYCVADYDDQIDKVTNYQRVSLSDIVMIEFGQPESGVSLFKNKQHHCIRINYKISCEYGYFHMFRSTNLRFFNNMAVVIKTEEETIESLKAICEAFSVAVEIAGLPKIPIAMNVGLDKRTSKTVNVKGSTGLLDISSFPHLTRNVSETQLLALKSAGTKALSNVSEQLSKLNKFGHTIAGKKSGDSSKSESSLEKKKSSDGKSAKSVFTVGNRDIEGNRKSRSNSGSSSASSRDSNERAIDTSELEDTENFTRASVPSSGMAKAPEEKANADGNVAIFNCDYPGTKAPPSSDRTFDGLSPIPPGDADRCNSMGRIDRAGASTPEITIQTVGDNGILEEKERAVPPSSLNLPKNISHSTGEVDDRTSGNRAASGCSQADDGTLRDDKRSNSEQDLASNITSSRSESALKSMKNNITDVASPVTSTAKEILSPFSKFAKGVQSFGANLDPRKLKAAGHAGIARNLSDHHSDQRRKLEERWCDCSSRLIAL